MEKAFILSRRKNNEDTKVLEVCSTLQQAQEILLDEINKDLEYGNYTDASDFIVLDEEKTTHNGGVLKSTDPDFRTAEVFDKESGIKAEYRIEEKPVIGAKVPKWDVVYDEDIPDTNGYCSNGILSDGQGHFLFFGIWRNDDELIEYCSIRSNMEPIEGTEICRYPWTSENDEILLDCLNKCGDYYCGECSPLYSLEFKQPELPEFVDATIIPDDEPQKLKKVIIKLNQEKEKKDEKIFHYCKDFKEFLSLKEKGNKKGFSVFDWKPLYREEIKGL